MGVYLEERVVVAAERRRAHGLRVRVGEGKGKSRWPHITSCLECGRWTGAAQGSTWRLTVLKDSCDQCVPAAISAALPSISFVSSACLSTPPPPPPCMGDKEGRRRVSGHTLNSERAKPKLAHNCVRVTSASARAGTLALW